MLTAAHCNIKASRHVVYLGGAVRHSRRNAAVVARVATVDTHRDYALADSADVSLVTLRGFGTLLKKRLEAGGARPIDVDWSGRAARRGRRMRTAGFGGTRRLRDPPLARTLRAIDVYRLRTRSCLRRYFFTEDERYAMCAAAPNNASVCKGDSGGPLIANDARGRPVLVGIVVARTSSHMGWSCNPGAVILGMKLRAFKGWVTRRVGKWRRW